MRHAYRSWGLPGKERLANLALLIISLVFTLIAAEVAARIYRSDFHFGSRLGKLGDLFRSAYLAQHDGLLGWVPKPGTTGQQNIWGTEVSILGNGMRANSAYGDPTHPTPADRPLIMAFGNSYTFGDEVSDHDTWPAILERITGMRTMNAGVSGYGVDQSVLRAELLLDSFAPEMIIFSLIPDDIERTQMSKRTGVKKPYFVLLGQKLELRGIPVPPAEEYRKDGISSIDALKDLLSRSLLAHKLMIRIAPSWWFYGRFSESTTVHRDGEIISCKLIVRLAERLRSTKIAFVVLLQYPWPQYRTPFYVEQIGRLKSCMAKDSVPVLDTAEHLHAIEACNTARIGQLYTSGGGHMTGAGNQIIAKLLKPRVDAALRAVRTNPSVDETECKNGAPR